jgi:hypothetical protein
VGIRVRKMVAVGNLVHKYDEIICSYHQGGHPASHHDPPVGGPWWILRQNYRKWLFFFFFSVGGIWNCTIVRRV